MCCYLLDGIFQTVYPIWGTVTGRLPTVDIGKIIATTGATLDILAQWLEHSVYKRGVASLSLTIGILTENFSAGTRSSCVQ